MNLLKYKYYNYKFVIFDVETLLLNKLSLISGLTTRFFQAYNIQMPNK